MRFIPKQKLCEGMAANPLDKVVNEDPNITELAEEGILTAVAAETDAINQYTQVLELVSKSEIWLKELVYDQLQDIINEEKKHLAQLSNLVSHFPHITEQWNKGWEEAETGEDKSEGPSEEPEVKEEENTEESVKESVQLEEDVAKNRTYDTDSVMDVICSLYDLTDEQEDEAYSYIFRIADDKFELTPEELEMWLASFGERFELDENELQKLQDAIVQNAKNPQEERIEDFKDYVNYDISTLEDLLEIDEDEHGTEHKKIYTKSCENGLLELIDNLKNLEYNGDKAKKWERKKPTKKVSSWY